MTQILQGKQTDLNTILDGLRSEGVEPGTMVVTTDTNKIYRDNGETLDEFYHVQGSKGLTQLELTPGQSLNGIIVTTFKLNDARHVLEDGYVFAYDQAYLIKGEVIITNSEGLYQGHGFVKHVTFSRVIEGPGAGNPRFGLGQLKLINMLTDADIDSSITLGELTMALTPVNPKNDANDFYGSEIKLQITSPVYSEPSYGLKYHLFHKLTIERLA